MAEPLLSFGFLVNKYFHEAAYFKNISKAAKKLNMKCIMFRPLDVQFANGTLTGFTFNLTSNKWERSTFQLPHYIYDRCFYGKDAASVQNKKAVQKLKIQQNVSFLGYGFPDKWKQYKTLKTDPFIYQYLPETEYFQHPDQVYTFLQSYEECILKPIHGSSGKGVLVIKKEKETLFLYFFIGANQRIVRLKHFNQLKPFLAKRQVDSYILQRLLPLKDKQQRPFDLRILFQKNEFGQWIMQGKGIRIGQKHTYVSNLSKGGSVVSLEQWEKDIPRQRLNHIYNQIEQLAHHLPQKIEKNFAPLFELGVDIGIDLQNETIWILDINSKPGRNVVLKTDPARKTVLYEAPVRYARYLQHSLQTGVEINDLSN
ncbi:YheC/YheD family protein [Aeribacillus sp. FSL K6-8210]|uniref:YheC/YheD family endospore coat-associated protein n=1 Tax=unclassified Aeribacillus TaxID=2640495 RepID=UPI0028728482|nr:YheC/YheD family protein [Aeribacillus pallidus]